MLHNKRTTYFIAAIALGLMVTFLSGCGLGFAPAPSQDQINNLVATAMVQTQQAEQSVASTPNALTTGNFAKFTPDWSGMSTSCPSPEDILKAHGLTMDMLANSQLVPVPAKSWEPCQVVVELKDQYVGTKIPTKPGYVYTADTPDGVIIFLGGDPNVQEITLQHGTTFRYGPTYQSTKEGKWLDPNDQRELACRDVRFGFYHRNLGNGQPLTPYFGRTGPYGTQLGNLNVDWNPPSPDATVPQNYMDACAMLGGLARGSEWSHSPDKLHWAWKYTGKVPGSSTYCPQGDPCSQTPYVPNSSLGYVEIWYQGGVHKFYAQNNKTLMDGQHNVDEFSYTAVP